MTQSKKDNIKGQYGRVKGAPWFPLLHKRDIMILGQGGIGSWVSFLLARTGANLHIYDMDRYEEHNMTGQVAKQRSIGMLKTEAMHDIIQDFSPDCQVEVYGEYKLDSDTSDIVICGFDNMVARKIAFQRWCEHHASLNTDEERKGMFFQDGRLLAEQLQIFNIPGGNWELIEKYEKEFLFADAEVAEAECTFKQTSHCAAMIASHMVGFLTNHLMNGKTGSDMFSVPFKYEYLIPLNLTS